MKKLSGADSDAPVLMVAFENGSSRSLSEVQVDQLRLRDLHERQAIERA